MEHNEETNHETTHTEHHETHHKTKKSRSSLIAIIISVIVIVLAAGLTWLYTGKISEAKTKVFKAIPLPGAIVDMKLVPAKSILTRVDLSKQLLDAQGLGDKADPSKTFDQIIDIKKLEAVAASKGVSASQAEIDEEYKNIITQYAKGDENAFKDELTKAYHMGPDQFKSDVVRQQVLQNNLLYWYSKQPDLDKASYEKAKELMDKINSGQSFDDVTKAYTQDEATKDFAGDSGMIAFSDLLPEFREQLNDVKVGDVKQVVSRYGLHILKVLELNNDGENGAKQIHLQQIFIKQNGFDQWITDQTDKIRVVKLLKF